MITLNQAVESLKYVSVDRGFPYCIIIHRYNVYKLAGLGGDSQVGWVGGGIQLQLCICYGTCKVRRPFTAQSTLSRASCDNHFDI